MAGKIRPSHVQLATVCPRTTAVPAVARSPWAPLLAVAGQKQVLLYSTSEYELVGILAEGGVFQARPDEVRAFPSRLREVAKGLPPSLRRRINVKV